MDQNVNDTGSNNAAGQDFDLGSLSTVMDKDNKPYLDEAGITSLKAKGLKGSAPAVMAQMGKSYLAMERMQAGRLFPPADGAKPEDVAAFRTKVADVLKLPNNADAYKLALAADWPQDIQINPELEKSFRGILAKHRASPELGQELFDLHNGFYRKIIEADRTAKTEAANKATTELVRQEGTIDLLKGKIAAIQQKIGEIGQERGYKQEDVIKALDETGFGNNVILFNIIADLVEAGSPFPTPTGHEHSGTTAKTALEAAYAATTP